MFHKYFKTSVGPLVIHFQIILNSFKLIIIFRVLGKKMKNKADVITMQINLTLIFLKRRTI